MQSNENPRWRMFGAYLAVFGFRNVEEHRMTLCIW